jgi:hypothetical protein
VAAVFALTTLARFKSHKGDDGTNDDGVIALLIPAVSGAVARFLDRHLVEADRTEYFDVRPGQQRYQLRGYPVNTDETFEVRNDINTDFPASTVVSSDNYFINAEKGLLVVNGQSLDVGAQALRIQYTGGLVPDEATLQTDHPEVEGAAWFEISQALQKNPNYHAISKSVGGSSLASEGAIDLLPWTKSILGHLRFTGV